MRKGWWLSLGTDASVKSGRFWTHLGKCEGSAGTQWAVLHGERGFTGSVLWRSRSGSSSRKKPRLGARRPPGRQLTAVQPALGQGEDRKGGQDRVGPAGSVQQQVGWRNRWWDWKRQVRGDLGAFPRSREGVRKGNGFGFGPMGSDSVCTDVWLPLDTHSVLSQRRARGSREMFLRLQQQRSEGRSCGWEETS